ncbi:MAG: TIGR03790 family protein [Armatimonadetes bacterium]|nr:TIGR03790 family protein [Armatimonadota bacterium]
MPKSKRRFAPSLIVFSLVLIGAAWTAIGAPRSPAPVTAPAALVATRGNVAPDDPRRVLIVYNAQSPESEELARRYAQERNVPETNLVGLLCPDTDEIRRSEYESTILPYIRERAASDPQIAYIVLMRGIPFRFRDWGNFGGYAVDSVLATCLMTLPPPDAPNAPLAGMVKAAPERRLGNPYFGANERFSRERFGGMLLVCRLDGTTVADAFRPVESARNAKPVSGIFYLRDSFCMSMAPCNAVLNQKSLDTEYVTPANNPLAPRYEGTQGAYMAHWGAGPHDTQYSDAEFGKLRFSPGGICDLTWSSSAMHLRNPKAKAGINLLTSYAGAAGAHGFVSEPYCDSVSRSEIVLERYTRGHNIAESFYMGSPYLHWKDVVLGDPLCAPYADKREVAVQ